MSEETPKKRRVKKTTASKSSTPSLKREKSKTAQPLVHPRFPKLPPRPTAQYDAEGNELWCICNKPDNGTLMLGCDGCDSWFHARCVKVLEKHNKLISKFFCPYCELEGKGSTLWKRKCRLQTCFEPIAGNDTKYCGKEHGILFMKTMLQEVEQKKLTVKTDKDNNREDDDEEEDDREDLSRSQISQIIKHTASFTHFKQLGQSMPKAPIDIDKDPRIITNKTTLTNAVKQTEWLSKKKEMLNKTRENVKKINEEITLAMDNGASKKKTKKFEICGFDPLLNNKAEFFDQFQESSLATANISFLKDYFIKQHQKSTDPEDDTEMTDDSPPTICLLEKKKCSKHNGWQGMINDEVEMEYRDVQLQQRKAEDSIQRVGKVLSVDYFEKEARKQMLGAV